MELLSGDCCVPCFNNKDIEVLPNRSKRCCLFGFKSDEASSWIGRVAFLVFEIKKGDISAESFRRDVVIESVSLK